VITSRFKYIIMKENLLVMMCVEIFLWVTIVL